jgi:hypothetical protein
MIPAMPTVWTGGKIKNPSAFQRMGSKNLLSSNYENFSTQPLAWRRTTMAASHQEAMRYAWLSFVTDGIDGEVNFISRC